MEAVFANVRTGRIWTADGRDLTQPELEQINARFDRGLGSLERTGNADVVQITNTTVEQLKVEAIAALADGNRTAFERRAEMLRRAGEAALADDLARSVRPEDADTDEP